MSSAPIPDIEQELGKLPPAVLEAYQEALAPVTEAFGADEIGLWAKEGLAIGTQTIRSWEAAIEYYRVSPHVSRFLSFPSFMQWARCGTYLAQDSPTLSVAFFKSSVAIVPNLRPQYIPRWAGLGRSLYKGTWKSSTLAAKFFEVSPDLVRSLPFWDVEVFASLIEALSYKSYDVAGECLVLGKDVLPGMGREREPFLAMARALIDSSWREVKTCLELVPRALQHVDEAQTGRFLKLGERLAKVGLRDTSRFLSDGTQALGRVPQGSQGYILDLCDQLVAVAPEAVPPFLRSLDDVLNRITVSQLDTWYQHGLRLLQENPESGIAFFKIESNTSEAMLETLSSSLELERVKGILRLYCRALSGSGIEIFNTHELVRRNIGWVDEDSGLHRRLEGVSAPGGGPLLQQAGQFLLVQGPSLPTRCLTWSSAASSSSSISRPPSSRTGATASKRRLRPGGPRSRPPAAPWKSWPGSLPTKAFPSASTSPSRWPPPKALGSARAYTDIGRFLAMFENGKLAFDLFHRLGGLPAGLPHQGGVPRHQPRRVAGPVGDPGTPPPDGGDAHPAGNGGTAGSHELGAVHRPARAQGIRGSGGDAVPHPAPASYRGGAGGGHRRGNPPGLRDYLPPAQPDRGRGKLGGPGPGRTRRLLRRGIPGLGRPLAGRHGAERRGPGGRVLRVA